MTGLLQKLGGLARRTSRRFSAIDFDSRQLRIVHAEQTSSGVRIIKLATADVPEGLDIADAQAVGEFVGRTLAQMNLSNASILMNVPRGQAVLKPLILPPVATTAELASMVQYQAEKELSFRPSEAVIDFTLESHYGAAPAGEDQAEGEHVLVAAVQRPIVEFYQKVAEVAGARLLRLGLRPYANMRCVQAYAANESQGRVAIVHITADEVEIDICDAGAMTFSRAAVVSVPSAGDGAEAPAAEAAATVVTEVTRSLQSYLGVERENVIDAILVAGGTGIESRVAEDLARRLAVRCEMLNPAQALGLEDQGSAASAFISALGLAIGQAPDVELPFNFLDPKRAPVRRDLRKMATVAAMAGLVVLLVAVLAGASLHYLAASSRLEALRNEYNDLTKSNQKVTAMAKRVETIDAWVRAGRNWLDHWAYLSAAFPPCTDTYITALKTNPDGSVNFTVKARSNEAINDLNKRLEAAGYDFKVGQVSTGADPYGYTYATSVKVITKPTMKVDLASIEPAPRPEDDASAELFGKPPAVVAAAAKPQTAGSSSPDQPGPDAPYPVRMKAWTSRFEALSRERPPQGQTEAYNAWQARREALRAEYPKPTPSSQPPPSSVKPHRHE
jgi:Tfp pilus assembly PilM family ATPase